nr:tetratricopeptide repeat protein [Actinomycetota bacterium]
RLAEWSEALARHWGNTGNAGRAAYYTAMAAEKNRKIYALETAHRLFGQAAGLIDANPGCADEHFWAGMILNWGELINMLGDYKGVCELLEPCLARFEALGDKRQLSIFLSWLGLAYAVRGQGARAKPLLDRAMALAQEIEDDECYMQAGIGLGWLYSYWMPYSEHTDALIKQYAEQALETGRKIKDNVKVQHAYTLLGIHHIQRSRFSDARRYSMELYDHGRMYQDDRSLALAHWMLGFCDIYEDRYEEALRHCEQSLELNRNELNLDGLCALAGKGGALALTGSVQEGLVLMATAKHEMLAKEFIMPLSGVEIPLGAIMVLAGQMKKGIRHIEHFMEHWAAMGNSAQPVWGHLFLSEIFLQLALGKEKPPFKIILKNIGFILLNAPTARRKARYHLEEVVKKSRQYNMPGFLAKALYGLGILEQTRKNYPKSRSYLEEGLKIASESGLLIAGRIRLTLDSIL